MRKLQFLAFLPAVLALGACVPTIQNTDFEAALSTPETLSWRTDLQGSSTVSKGWWREIGDHRLDVLVDEALTSNTDIQIAATRIRQAQSMEAIARSALLPSIGTLGLGSRSSNDAFGRTTESTGVQGVARISYEVDLFGRIANQVDAAEAGVSAQMTAKEAVELSVTAAVVRTYITLVGLDEQRKSLKASQEVYAQILELAREQERAGYTSSASVDRAESFYLAVSEQLPVIDNAIAQAENALSFLLGRAPGEIERAGALDSLNLLEAPKTVPSELVRNRPDIAAAEFQVAATDKQLSAARAQFLPRVRLSALIGLAESSVLNNGLTLWSAGGSVLAPIFQGGRLQGNFDNADARRMEAAFAYRRSVLQAFREVEDSLSSAARLQDQSELLDERLAVSKRAEAHAIERFEEGYVPKMEPLNAAANRLSLEISQTRLLAERSSAMVTLYQSLGGGWEASASSDPRLST